MSYETVAGFSRTPRTAEQMRKAKRLRRASAVLGFLALLLAIVLIRMSLPS